MRFRRSALAVVCGFTITALAACGGQQVGQSVAGVMPQQSVLSRAHPDKECRGTGGVRISPCHVKFKAGSSGYAAVTVSGPGVANSEWNQSGCGPGGNVCTIQKVYPLTWDIFPGSSCGSARVKIEGLNSSGSVVGSGFLKVVNRDCG